MNNRDKIMFRSSELNPQYCSIAATRIDKETGQTDFLRDTI